MVSAPLGSSVVSHKQQSTHFKTNNVKLLTKPNQNHHEFAYTQFLAA